MHHPLYYIYVSDKMLSVGNSADYFFGAIPCVISSSPEYSPGDKNNGGGWLVVPKVRWEKPKLLFMGKAPKGLPYTMAKLTPVPVAAPSTPGTGAYVMSANGDTSTVMTVSTR